MTVRHHPRGAVAATLAMLIASIAGVGALRAQSVCTTAPPANSCSADVSLTLATVPTMDLRLSSSDVAFPRAAAAELRARFVSGSAVSAVIRSNVPWQLQIALAEELPAAMDASAEGSPSGLQWSTTPNGRFAELTHTPAQVASGDPGTGHRVTIHLRKRVDWHTAPGKYAHTITSTLTAP